MKTAMQELIEKLKGKGGGMEIYLNANTEIINEALEKEKEQIIKDYHKGQMGIADLYKESLQKLGVYEELLTDFEDAEEYYNITFKQNK
jgi:ribosomal protein L10